MRTLFVLFVLCFMPGAACQDAKSIATSGGKALVDCTAKQIAPTLTEFGPVMERVVLDAVDPSGKVNWSPVKDVAKGFTKDIGGCLLADVVARLLAPKADATQNAPLMVDRDSLLSGFAELRTSQFGGATYKTASGEL